MAHVDVVPDDADRFERFPLASRGGIRSCGLCASPTCSADDGVRFLRDVVLTLGR
jgi:hypothetical protein